MDWSTARKRLDSSYLTVVRTVQAVNPMIGAARENAPVAGSSFRTVLYFMHDAASQRYEDLVMSFTCRPAKPRFVSDGAAPHPGRDILRFEVSRGSGHELFSLEPVVLPRGDDSPEYQRAVLDFVDRTTTVIAEHIDLVVETLKTPYDIEEQRPVP